MVHVAEERKNDVVGVVVHDCDDRLRQRVEDEARALGTPVVDITTWAGSGGPDLSPGVAPDDILWFGWPGEDVTGRAWAPERLWVYVDHADLARLQARRGPEILEQIGRLAQVRGVLTPDPAALEYLCRRMAGRAAKIYAMGSRSSLSEAVQQVCEVRRGEDAPRLLLHRPNRFRVRAADRAAPAAVAVHELCETPGHVQDSRADARHLLGASPEQRTGERIRTRNAAWHLASAAQVLGDSVLITDELEVARALAGYKSLDARLWVLLDRSAVTELVDPEAPRHAESSVGVQAVLGKGGSIVVCDAQLRETLRDVAGTRGRILLAGENGELDLDRARELVREVGTTWSLPEQRTVLLAGHDFKFAGEIVDVLGRIDGARVIFDKWELQHRQSVRQSDEALRGADVILCEFASHNAVWYSWHKLPGQRLVVHFHGYELFQDWITDINVANVDAFVFVSEFYRARVVEELGWPREKTVVVPNMVDPMDLDRPKTDDARFHLAIVGIVPVLKRPDLALDLLERLLEEDDRYVLHVRGRDPWDYQWMWRDPVLRDAYEGFYERLARDPRLLQHVAFDGFGADMGGWFRRIGWTLSPSYRETFHLAPVEGMAGGAVPVVWARAGAEEIFGPRWVHGSTEEAARFILRANGVAEDYCAESRAARLAARRYSVQQVGPRWVEVLFAEAGDAPRVDPRFERAALEERYRAGPTAAALDRLLLYLLKQESDVDAVDRLMADHPKQALSASAETKSLLAELRAHRMWVNGDFVRPDRCHGVVYQAPTGLPLIADVVDGSGAGDSPSGRPVLNVRTPGGGPAREMCRVPADAVPTHTVQVLADGLVRDARRSRPSALVTPARPDLAWATVVAARRLGVPAVLAGEAGGDPALPPVGEFDATVAEGADVTPDVVAGAVRRHAEQVAAAAPQREVHELTVGIIADEFTSRTVSGRCRTVPIHRENAYLQVATTPLDVLFVESAWTGADREWFHGIAYYQDEREDIERVVEVARAQRIPVLFWNKEDPVHFRSFAPTAALCDVVFTTDADRVPAYLKNGDGRRPSVVASLPFYAEPRVHNPLPGTWEEKRTISYAGTYYGARFADRSAELDSILARASVHGLTIYDRQKTVPESPYRFPERFEEHIEGGLSYDDVLEAYKAHPVHINVNSVHDSPTMFSRRVVEIAASGAVVVSGRGRGLVETLPAVPTFDDADALERVMASCMRDRHAWARLAWAELRAVRRSHRADQALTLMFRSAGLTLRTDSGVPWTARVRRLDLEVAVSLTAQSMPATAVTAVVAEDEAVRHLSQHGVEVVPEPATEWWTQWTTGLPGTWAEDLLYAAHFAPGDVGWIGGRPYNGEHGLLRLEEEPPDGPVFRRRSTQRTRGLVWLLTEEATVGEPRHGLAIEEVGQHE